MIEGKAPNHFSLGPLNANPHKSTGSDRLVLEEGWISLTPLIMDVSAYNVISSLEPKKFFTEP